MEKTTQELIVWLDTAMALDERRVFMIEGLGDLRVEIKDRLAAQETLLSACKSELEYRLKEEGHEPGVGIDNSALISLLEQLHGYQSTSSQVEVGDVVSFMATSHPLNQTYEVIGRVERDYKGLHAGNRYLPVNGVKIIQKALQPTTEVKDAN